MDGLNKLTDVIAVQTQQPEQPIEDEFSRIGRMVADQHRLLATPQQKAIHIVKLQESFMLALQYQEPTTSTE